MLLLNMCRRLAITAVLAIVLAALFSKCAPPLPSLTSIDIMFSSSSGGSSSSSNIKIDSNIKINIDMDINIDINISIRTSISMCICISISSIITS